MKIKLGAVVFGLLALAGGVDAATPYQAWLDKPLEQIRQQAQNNDASAQAALGAMYKDGVKVVKDKQQALLWLRKAAEQGNTSAQISLANLYVAEGREGDYEAAAELYRQAFATLLKAAEQGEAERQHDLGFMYLHGVGVEQNDAEAANWFRKAAQQGLVDAEVSLGWMYQGGRGVEQDYGQAADWYRKGVARGYDLAQVNLGWMYANGLGMQADAAKAVELYRLAAVQGLGNAQVSLGWMYLLGKGVRADPGEAYAWFAVAKVNGSPTASRSLEQVEPKLSGAWLAAAKKLARRYIAQYAKQGG